MSKSEADDDVVVERPDDDDYDLLTYAEAGARLAEEVIKQGRRIDDMRAADASADELAVAEARLAMLRQAIERNRKPSPGELRDAGFFGPTGQARGKR